MKKAILTILILLVVLIGGFMGYLYLTQPELAPVPPVPAESSEVAPAATTTEPVETAQSETSSPAETAGDEVVEVKETEQPAIAAKPDILLIEVAGQTSGTIEILLNTEVAPGHVARIKALTLAGAYDNIVFHRVIDGFMAQTGDVKFGKRGAGTLGNAGMGGSDMDNLKAEFSKQMFDTGVVGMARSNDPDSANSQFFIMFGPAPYLNGKYTIVGRVIAGQEIVDAIKKGDPNLNGTVVAPDYMKTVRLKDADE